jgi:hypothetical protein
VFGFGYTGFPVGLDVAFGIIMPDGTAVILAATDGMPMTVTKTSSGCLSYKLTAAATGAATMPAGTYEAQLFAGPNLDPVGSTVKLNVTAPTTNGSQTGAGN